MVLYYTSSQALAPIAMSHRPIYSYGLCIISPQESERVFGLLLASLLRSGVLERSFGVGFELVALLVVGLLLAVLLRWGAALLVRVGTVGVHLSIGLPLGLGGLAALVWCRHSDFVGLLSLW